MYLNQNLSFGLCEKAAAGIDGQRGSVDSVDSVDDRFDACHQIRSALGAAVDVDDAVDGGGGRWRFGAGRRRSATGGRPKSAAESATSGRCSGGTVGGAAATAAAAAATAAATAAAAAAAAADLRRIADGPHAAGQPAHQPPSHPASSRAFRSVFFRFLSVSGSLGQSRLHSRSTVHWPL